MANALGRAPLVLGEAAVRRALHRVDEVVGRVDPVERLAEAGAADGVADDDVVEQDAGGSDPLGRAREAAHGVSRRLQARDERGPDVARDRR